jgi:hypothetical protein
VKCGDPRCEICAEPAPPVVARTVYPTGVVVELLGGPAVEKAPVAKPAPERRFPNASIVVSARPRRLF